MPDLPPPIRRVAQRATDAAGVIGYFETRRWNNARASGRCRKPAKPAGPADQAVPPSSASMCSADETLNSPGASTNSFFTTPFSAYSAKRRARVPMP